MLADIFVTPFLLHGAEIVPFDNSPNTSGPTIPQICSDPLAVYIISYLGLRYPVPHIIVYIHTTFGGIALHKWVGKANPVIHAFPHLMIRAKKRQPSTPYNCDVFSILQFPRYHSVALQFHHLLFRETDPSTPGIQSILMSCDTYDASETESCIAFVCRLLHITSSLDSSLPHGDRYIAAACYYAIECATGKAKDETQSCL